MLSVGAAKSKAVAARRVAVEGRSCARNRCASEASARNRRCARDAALQRPPDRVVRCGVQRLGCRRRSGGHCGRCSAAPRLAGPSVRQYPTPPCATDGRQRATAAHVGHRSLQAFSFSRVAFGRRQPRDLAPMPTLRTSHGAWRTPQPCAGSADAAVRFAELAASYDHRVDDVHRWVRPPLALPRRCALTLYAVHSMPHVLTFS